VIAKYRCFYQYLFYCWGIFGDTVRLFSMFLKIRESILGKSWTYFFCSYDSVDHYTDYSTDSYDYSTDSDYSVDYPHYGSSYGHRGYNAGYGYGNGPRYGGRYGHRGGRGNGRGRGQRGMGRGRGKWWCGNGNVNKKMILLNMCPSEVIAAPFE